MTTNAPAFPLTEQTLIGDGRGMTLRDYFAAQVLTAMDLTAECVGDEITNDDDVRAEYLARQMAEAAYRIADAMLEAREVK